jgi:hypothetical protein
LTSQEPQEPRQVVLKPEFFRKAMVNNMSSPVKKTTPKSANKQPEVNMQLTPLIQKHLELLKGKLRQKSAVRNNDSKRNHRPITVRKNAFMTK